MPRPTAFPPRLPHAIIALLLAVLGTSACETGPAPAERLSGAAEATRAEQTAAFTLDMNVRLGGETDDPGSEMNVDVTGDGVRDFEEEIARTRMSSPGSGRPITVVSRRDTVYLQMPPALGGGSEIWIRLSTGAGAGAGPGLAGEATDMLDALEGVGGDVRGIGRDQVRGEAVDGYALTLRGESLWGEARNVPQALHDLELPTEVWLDARDRVRRVVTEIDVGTALEAARAAIPDTLSDSLATVRQERIDQALGGMSGTITITIEYFDFGTEVEAGVPADAEIVDAQEFRRRMMEGGPASGSGDGSDGDSSGG